MGRIKQRLPLTNRELEVLKLLADGYSNQEVGKLLGLSPRTAEAHRARIMLKLGLYDLPALVKHAIKIGITSATEHRTRDEQQ
jgi:DNA-binding CsgD family transcriptional regulator